MASSYSRPMYSPSTPSEISWMPPKKRTAIRVVAWPVNCGIPAMRNTIPLRECLEEAYLKGPTVHNPSGQIPNDPEIPLLLNKVYPAHEVVKVDYYLQGCPPSADALWAALTALLTKQPLNLPYALVKYD